MMRYNDWTTKMAIGLLSDAFTHLDPTRATSIYAESWGGQLPDLNFWDAVPGRRVGGLRKLQPVLRQRDVKSFASGLAGKVVKWKRS